jgi:hypothetical protein|tara:strand:- start:184 stop:324 length:141 start_codon:yes stop_codon:yes gene_type:complete
LQKSFKKSTENATIKVSSSKIKTNDVAIDTNINPNNLPNALKNLFI